MNTTIYVIIGISFIFLMTTLGGAVVFLFRKPASAKVNSLFLGFASGLMIAASVWSLIIPAISQSEGMGGLNFLPASLGIVLGAAFLVVMDKVLPKLFKLENKNGLSKSGKLFLAVTLHNVPEGLAVGLAFGNAVAVGQTSAFISALWLAIGIGIQNLPEGGALALPLREKYASRVKAFAFTALSGIVEPIMAVAGVFLAGALSPLMPYLLAFSAGSMLLVVAHELVPDAKDEHGSYIGSWGFIVGFVLMMILDVALG
ncbi:MAG: ZIP family metal transporter [Clostridia bacterium]|nr:ZIP family metal transporter [Clostridia bacterium]